MTNYQRYQLEEISFAYCYRIFLRWRTHRAQSLPVLAGLDILQLQEIGELFDIRILEANCSDTDVMALASLRPTETVSACVGKLKGKTSKWLRETMKLNGPESLLSKGYFACTTGDSRADSIARYLAQQSSHHGYSQQMAPPVFVRSYPLTAADQRRLSAQHATTCLRHHVVLATRWRKCVLDASSGAAIADCFVDVVRQERAALLKIAVIPDHVHLAIQIHPSVSPAALVLQLMNAAESLIWNEFSAAMLVESAEQLWQPSAYLGSYGDLATPQIAKYIQDWTNGADGRR